MVHWSYDPFDDSTHWSLASPPITIGYIDSYFTDISINNKIYYSQHGNTFEPDKNNTNYNAVFIYKKNKNTLARNISL